MDRWDLVATAATSFAAAGSWSWREFGSTDPVMIDTLRACLDHLAEGPLAAMVLACLQMEHYYARQSEVSEAFGRQSVEMARRTGDPAVLLRVLLVGALAAWGQLSTAQRVQLGKEIVQLPMDAEQQVLGWWNYGTALHQAGRPVASDAAMARCFAAADRLRHPARTSRSRGGGSCGRWSGPVPTPQPSVRRPSTCTVEPASRPCKN